MRGWIGRAAAGVAASVGLLSGIAAAQGAPLRPDQARFREVYRELVETDTTMSAGSCTLAAQRMAARLQAAGFADAELHLFTAPDHRREGGLVAVLAGTAPDLPPGLAISGRVDRMVVGPERVLVVDFKTNRPSPDRIDTADHAYLVQMALYVAVLRTVFPGRHVDAALVWTDGPKLMPVPESLIASKLASLRRAG